MDTQLLDDVQSHLEDSNSYLETRRDDWDELEAMLIVSLTDDLSKTTQNRIYDPRLSTIVYERSSRVMAQNPKGKAYAQSKDDIGKNMLMNLLLKYFYKNSNEQDSMLIKLRLMDVYSLVYGSMFALVPWRVNKNGYTGPELNVLPIRDCFPQPTKRNVSDMDWFTVRNVVSIDWLKSQDDKVWKNIDKLEKELKANKDGGDKQIDDNKRSFIEKTYYPSTFSDVVFPQVEIYTEYREDKWVTWTPQRVNNKTSQPYILREANEAYVDNKLPIIAKHAFPLIDSPIGLGEFARGQSLQMAINSLWNLYMEGVKYSIFPPLHINPDEVVPSSIKWNPGEYWFMNRPNQDVQAMASVNPQGINTFQSTYGSLISSIETQAGTTSVRESANTKSSLGRTPEAIRFISEKESARDEWDRVMMEDTIDQMYTRWISLTVNKMEKDVKMRLFEDEIEDIAKSYPDVTELYESGRGQVNIRKKDIEAEYDFILETGSTTKVDIEEEQNNLTTILKAVLENPTILEALAAKNKTIDIGELFKRWLIAGGTKDWERVIIDMEQQPQQEEQQMSPQDQELMAQYQQPQMGQPQMEQPMSPVEQQPQMDIQALASQYQDPDIQQAILQTMSERMGGIPAQ
jgi:hypothetical protein